MLPLPTCLQKQNHVIGSVAIGNPERHVHKVRTVAASNNRDHPTRSLFYCLFAPHRCIFVLRAHPVRGESYNQRNTTGEVATVDFLQHEIEGNWCAKTCFCHVRMRGMEWSELTKLRTSSNHYQALEISLLLATPEKIPNCLSGKNTPDLYATNGLFES